MEEHAVGIGTVGLAFIDPLGRDFAVSISVPITRFVAKRDELGDALRATGAAIVAAIPGSVASVS